MKHPLLMSSAVFLIAVGQCGATPNCAHSQSWQCGHTPQLTGTSVTSPTQVIPQTGNPTGTAVAPLGSLPSEHHNVMLVPTLPPQPQVPQPQAIVVPPQVLPPQKTPMAIPPQPPQPQVPQPQAIVVPPQVLPPQKTPMAIPPQPPQQLSPHLAGIPPASHHLVIHPGHSGQPVTSGDHQGPAKYSYEFIEPGIQNHKVEVYRSHDARQLIYKDTIPLDAGAYHLRVIGIRDPGYIN